MKDIGEALDQRRSRGFQFFPVMQGKLVQDPGSLCRQRDLRAAAIRRRPDPSNHSAKLQPIHQTHGAVVPELKTLRKIANAGRFRLHRLDRQHQLMLLRFHARASGRFFAEVQEFTNLMAKFGQGANLLL
jgi:hypothetical protein